MGQALRTGRDVDPNVLEPVEASVVRHGLAAQSARRIAIPSTIRPTRSATGTPIAANSVSHFAPLGDGGPRTRVRSRLRCTPRGACGRRSGGPARPTGWRSRSGDGKTKLAMHAVPRVTRRVRPATSERNTMASSRASRSGCRR
jgi:hypothetical protein